MKDLRIIFMGTPDFATGVLQRMVAEGLQVVAVVTVADKPAGRGQKLQESSVKKYALSQQIPVLQPVSLRDEGFLAELKAFQADVQVVVAFRMLPKVVWQMPRKGTFNLHASLLPDYRGAAPINWAIINGETTTGVTTFLIDEQIDTGAMLLRKEVAIAPRETAGTLHDKLMVVGADLVVETLALIASGKVIAQPQEKQAVEKQAPKIHKETSRIPWDKSLEEIDRFVRGMAPYPTAWAELHHQGATYAVKLYEAIPKEATHTLPIGSIRVQDKQIEVAVQGGFLCIESLQFPSKKRMTAREFLNGFHFAEGDFFA